MRDARVGGQREALAVQGVPVRVVGVHFHQVLVRRVVARRPPTIDVEDLARLRAEDAARQAGPGFVARVQEVGLGALDQLAVLRVARQVREALPFDLERAYLGETGLVDAVVTQGAVGEGLVLDEQTVDGDAARGVEGELQDVGQRRGLGEQRVDLGRVDVQVVERSLEQVVCAQHAAKVADVGLKETHDTAWRRDRLGEVHGGDVVQDEVDNVRLLHHDGRAEGIEGSHAPSVAGVGEAVVLGPKFVVGEGVRSVAFPGEAEHVDHGTGADGLVLLKAGVVVVVTTLLGVCQLGAILRGRQSWEAEKCCAGPGEPAKRCEHDDGKPP